VAQALLPALRNEGFTLRVRRACALTTPHSNSKWVRRSLRSRHSSQPVWSPCLGVSVAAAKKNAAQFHLAAGSNLLSWFTSLPSQPPRARAHKSTTRATASAADPLATVPHPQKPTPVLVRLQPSPTGGL